MDNQQNAQKENPLESEEELEKINDWVRDP